MPPMSDTDWLYLQIFPGSIDQSDTAPRELERLADHVLAHCLIPTLRRLDTNGTTTGYFFIRYAENGYHLRARCQVHGEDDRAAARRELLSALDAYLQSHPESFPGARDSMGLMADGRLCYRVYEPELDKYGGREALDIVEIHFRGCSDLAAAVIELGYQGLKRDHIALWLMGQIVYASGFGAGDAAGLLAGYARYWMPGLGNGLDTGGQSPDDVYLARQHSITALLPDEHGESCYALTYPRMQKTLVVVRQMYSDTLTQLRTLEDGGRLQSSSMLQLQATTRTALGLRRYPLTHLQILPNLIHMMNNRIGINVWSEARLAYFIARAYSGNAEVLSAAMPISLQPLPVHGHSIPL